MSSTATPMWSILPNIGGAVYAPRRSSAGLLDAEDLGQRRDADLELLGRRLLGRQVALDLAAGVWKASARGSPWWRSLQANISTAIEAPPRPTPARASGARLLDQPLQQHRAAGREQHHRGDQVGAAAVVLLGHRGGVVDPLLVGGDRLVLDPVVGGEVAVHQRHHRRHRAERLDQALAQRPRPERGGAAPRSATRVVPTAATTRQSSKGSRAAGRRRRTSGSTAIASASLSGPRRPGHPRHQLRRQLRLALGGDLDRAVAVAHRGGPVRRPVDQQAVAQRHPTQPQLLGVSGSNVDGHLRDHCPRRSTAARRRRSVESTPLPLVKFRPEAPSPGLRSGVSALPGSSLESRP